MTIANLDSRSLCLRIAAPLLLAAGLGFSTVAQAQEIRTTHVVENIYMITGAGGNVTVSIGDDGILLVDSGSMEHSDALLAAIRELSGGPIRYIVNTGVDPELVGGNVQLRTAGDTFTGGNATVVAGVDEGAAVVAHENALHRMVLDGQLPPEGWATDAFHTEKYDLYFNGEPVVMMYQGGAVDQSNLVVHFRRSDVVSTGNIFRLDTYPVFDPENGGSINGVIDSLNYLIDLAITELLAEGGTMLIPGHGRLSDEGDLVRYRDMVTIVRDRVQAHKEDGLSLEEVLAEEPSLDYDSRYASAQWSTEDFIEAVYNTLDDDS